MSEVTKQLEASGYKKHIAEFYQTLMGTDTLYQKRITDEYGTRYFINAWYFDNAILKDSVQFDVQFTIDEDAQDHINVTLVTNDIGFAEHEFAAIWGNLMYEYYETWS